MEPGRPGPSVLPLGPRPKRQAPRPPLSAQPALWPALAALALLSSVAEGEAPLGPAPHSPAPPREGPAPAPAPPAGPLPGRC
uniref:Artemin n=1 Tax=Sus scrofa TaxID=9823 RepID=A0A4X1W7I3_PIG